MAAIPTPAPTEFNWYQTQYPTWTPWEYTPSPTLSPVSKKTQITYMIIFFVVLFSCVLCAVCMSKSCCECTKCCLANTLGCKICEENCCAKKKKKKGAVGADDNWFLRYFRWASPLCSSPGDELFIFQRQLFLLCWKRVTENSRNTSSTSLYFALPAVSLFVMKLLYGAFSGFETFRSSGLIETFAAPLMFVIAVQMTAVSLVNEKTSRLQESMRMMGMRELPYWGSYIVVDAFFQGAALAVLLGALSGIMGLFWHTGAGKDGHGDGSALDLMALLFLSILALTTMAFAIAACFDNPQTAGMFSFLLLVGDVVLFFILIFTSPDLFDTATKQTLWCFFPPLALQIGIMSRFNCSCGFFLFIKSHIPFSTVLGMLFLDFVLFAGLAWYLGQVMPSEIGIRKPFYFVLLPSYWGLGSHAAELRNRRRRASSAQGVRMSASDTFNDLAQPLVSGGDGDRLDASSGGVSLKPQTTNPMNSAKSYPEERVNEGVTGAPTVSVHGLKKTFGSFKAVNGINFDLYEGQIFSLLGHNGAGKTTTINMLTGLFPPDADSGETSLYGSSIKDDITSARKTLGICPQHDVLFDNLTTREHVTFFALLKGAASWAAAEAEADELLDHFHMQERKHHVGAELSGGMKRKVSTAVALCGGSKFVILDEPTAGMDPLARRELWDLLMGLKKGRTMLLTTHYMDEADVLGDRIGIMSRGEIQCLGSSNYLKHHFGSGYKVVCSMEHGALATRSKASAGTGGGATAGGGGKMSNLGSSALARHPVTEAALRFVQERVPDASFNAQESSAASLVFVLPFAAAACFARLFDALDAHKQSLLIKGYGITITSLEEVFLKVGGDHDLDAFASNGPAGPVAFSPVVLHVAGQPAAPLDAQLDGSAHSNLSNLRGKGATSGARVQHPGLRIQVYGLWWKRLSSARHDLVRTIPLIGFPVAVAVAAFTLNVYGQLGVVGDFTSTLLTSLMVAAGYLPVVSLLTEAIVFERVTKLRNVLTVMGCDVSSYWLGQFAGDFTLLSVATLCVWVTAELSARISPFPAGDDVADDGALMPFIDSGKVLWLLVFSSAHVCSFCYFCSFFFPNTKTAIAFMPFFCIVMIFLPAVFVGIFWYGLGPQGADLIKYSGGAIFTNMLRGIVVCSPQGALAMGLLRAGGACAGKEEACVVPPLGEVLLIQAGEAVGYLYLAYLVDKQNLVPIEEHEWALPAQEVAKLDADVRAERDAVDANAALDSQLSHQLPLLGGGDQEQGVAPEPFALRLRRLRKLFPAKRLGDAPLQAVKSLSLGVARGELFGLLGANGAGKTTAISMVMRSLYPNAGSASIEGASVMSDFKRASKHLGVVTQHNTLWDRLTCVDHLRLFARLRGVPAGEVEGLVQDTVVQLELGPYAHRLAGQLSGGMKRKLCVAIAIVGDPDLVLLDEPSAGLDPVSRRNLWDTLIKTMANRAVVLTTHSMEEAEALCTRIGIMVKGQLQALGTPQHLKEKFGSGYEVIVQLDPALGPVDSPERVGAITSFIKGLFPVAELLSDNGGLLTFKLPFESIVAGTAGRAFDALETHKARLGISDYAVAQPTLEQVFVRTVLAHSEGERGHDGTATRGRKGLAAAPGAASSAGAQASSSQASSQASSLPDALLVKRKSAGNSPWVREGLGSDGEAQAQPARRHSSGEGSGSNAGYYASDLDGGALRLSVPAVVVDAVASALRPGSRQSSDGALRGSLAEAVEPVYDLDTGVATSWLGLDRRSHRWLGVSAGFFMYACYVTMITNRIGFLFFNFFVAWIFCMVGCIGCCCVIPANPDEQDDD